MLGISKTLSVLVEAGAPFVVITNCILVEASLPWDIGPSFQLQLPFSPSANGIDVTLTQTSTGSSLYALTGLQDTKLILAYIWLNLIGTG